jgi:hypothetical protein
MEEQIIKVKSNGEISSLRITKKTKKMLEALAQGRETHEEIILRLIKTVTDMSQEEGTKIINKGNLIGTQYQRANKTIQVETDKNKYSVVCTYNDLAVLSILKKSRYLRNYKYIAHEKAWPPEWELDLEITNISTESEKWTDPKGLKNKDRSEYLLLYLICVKEVLEKTFDIRMFEIITKYDYFSLEKWDKAYKRNDLSMESFYSDVQKRLK